MDRGYIEVEDYKNATELCQQSLYSVKRLQ